MADEDDAVIAHQDFGREMQIVLAGQVDAVAGALGPAEEVAVVARPAGGRVFLRVARRQRPFHVRIARHGLRRHRDFERHARCVWGQHDEAAAPWPLRRDHACILVAARAGDALIGVGAAPGVVGEPCSGCRDLQDAAGLPAGLWADDEEMVAGNSASIAAFGGQRRAIGSRWPVLADRQLERGAPSAAVDRTLVRRILPAAGDAPSFEHRCFDGAVPHDADGKTLGRRTDMEQRRFACAVREAVGVAPDLAALAVHPRIFVVVPAHGKAALFGGQAEVGELRWRMQCVHWLVRDSAVWLTGRRRLTGRSPATVKRLDPATPCPGRLAPAKHASGASVSTSQKDSRRGRLVLSNAHGAQEST